MEKRNGNIDRIFTFYHILHSKFDLYKENINKSNASSLVQEFDTEMTALLPKLRKSKKTNFLQNSLKNNKDYFVKRLAELPLKN